MMILMDHTEIPKTVETAIRGQVKKLFRDYAVESTEIVGTIDYDDHPVIEMKIRHGLIATPVDFGEISRMNTQIRDAAWKNGERRFVHISHLYADGQDFVELEPR